MTITGEKSELEEEHSDTALIEKWVLIRDDDRKKRRSTCGRDYEGTHCIGFVYIDHTAGITLHIETYCNVALDGEINITHGPWPDKIGVHVRYNSFPRAKSLVTIFSQEQMSVLSLPEKPDWLRIFNKPGFEPTRWMTFLHPLRAPGFPDDIKIVLLQNEREPEQVWGRIENVREDGFFECILLNRTYQDFGLTTGDLIEVLPDEIDGEPYMIWRPRVV